MDGRRSPGEPGTTAVDEPVPDGRRPAVLDALEEQARSMCRSEQLVCRALARGVDPRMEPAAYGVLSAVRTLGPCRVTDLAVTLGASKPAISNHVAALERLGLVQRNGGSDDERSRPVALTTEGMRRVDTARARRKRYFRRQLEGWDPGDVVELLNVLSRFNAAYLAADGPEVAPPSLPARGE